MSTFGARLEAALDARGSLCVGIDPHAALLAEWGCSEAQGYFVGRPMPAAELEQWLASLTARGRDMRLWAARR